MKTKRPNICSILISMSIVASTVCISGTTAIASDNNRPKIEKSYTQEYSSWGISYRDDTYYYNDIQIRIFMDIREDKSFEKFNFDEDGTLDLKLVRNSNGSIIKAEYISETEKSEILNQISISEDEYSEGEQYLKDIEDISRLELNELPSIIQDKIEKCKSNQWYAIESDNRQYIYFDGLPYNYAFEYQQDKDNLIVVDIGNIKQEYVLLSIGKNPNLNIHYNSVPVEFTKIAVN